MATHQRQVIRSAVQARLVAAMTCAEDRVFRSRVLPYGEIDLPAIAIYTRSEPVDPASESTAPRELTRNLRLVIEGAVQLTEDLDDALDALALEIENAIDRDETFGGAAADAVLVGTDITTSEEGAQPIGAVLLTYAITYYTRPGDAPATALDDFETAHVRTNLGAAVHPDNEAVDVVTVPTT